MISFPPGTEMFQFPGFALIALYIQAISTWLDALFTTHQGRKRSIVRWVSPFGNPGVEAYSRLTPAYRRVSRPSSPLAAKASTKRPSRA